MDNIAKLSLLSFISPPFSSLPLFSLYSFSPPPLPLLSGLPVFPFLVSVFLCLFLWGLFPQTCLVLVILLPQLAKYYGITGVMLAHPSKTLSF